jgi:predicted Holliday junction resolvase-like endonuclease
MNRLSYWKTVACLMALVLVSGLLGGLLGRRYAQIECARRSDPSHWNETATRELIRTVKPTPQQRAKLQEHLDAAVEDLKAIRTDTIARSANVVRRLVDQVEKELTPEQQVAFQRLKPKESDLSNLNLLNVKTRVKTGVKTGEK